jgi:hypothetical protein
MHLDPLVNLVNQATLTPDKLQSLAAISQYKQGVNSLVERMQRNDVAAINFVLERLYKSALNGYRTELDRFSQLPSNPAANSLILATPSVVPRAGDPLLADIAKSWVDASALMHAMLAARGVPYVHVLQPNQYFTKRPFSAEEAKVARSEASPFRKSAEKGYPVLVAQAKSGALKTVNFFNAVDVFDREPSAMYIDDCCHYTLKGNQLLGRAIAQHILASKGPWN